MPALLAITANPNFLPMGGARAIVAWIVAKTPECRKSIEEAMRQQMLSGELKLTL
jgi:hypothetical protein